MNGKAYCKEYSCDSNKYLLHTHSYIQAGGVDKNDCTFPVSGGVYRGYMLSVL
jgi:hypothetical protein